MIDLKRLRLFPFKTNDIAFTQDLNGENYNLIFYPENSSFTTAYPKMGIRRIHVRHGSIMGSKIPLYIANMNAAKHFRNFKLIPLTRDKADVRNIFIDTTRFMEIFEKRFRRTSLFRSNVIQQRLDNYFSGFPQEFPNRMNVLLYYVDLNNQLGRNAFQRRGWQVYHWLKNGSIFQYIVLCLSAAGTMRYYALKRPDGEVTPTRFFTILRSLKTNDLQTVENIDSDAEQISDTIINSIDSSGDSVFENDITPEGNVESEKIVSFNNKFGRITAIPIKNVIRNSVNVLFKEVPSEVTRNILHSANMSTTDATKLATLATVYNATRDIKRAKAISNIITPMNRREVFKAVKQQYASSIINKTPQYKNKNSRPLYQNVDIEAINDNKKPTNILNKRMMDFETTFDQDLYNSFKLLEKQPKYALKIVKFKKSPVPIDPSNLNVSKMVRYEVQLMGDNKKTHDVVIEIPQIQPDGTFVINGQKKYLEYQLVIDPIFFLKPLEAELQTSYATVAVHEKQTKHKDYFVCRVGGFWLPAFALLAYASGIENLCKAFGIKPVITDLPQPKGVNIPLSNGKNWCLLCGNKESAILANSLLEMKLPLPIEFLENQTGIREAIVDYTDNRNCITTLDTVLANIMEPIALRVLQLKGLPTTFFGCIHYICKHMAAGEVYKRNDISHQRIRSSEIFNGQIQSRILGSYNQYKRNREHGNNDAQYICDTHEIVNSIVVESRLMAPLENINPYEELSCMTRITPVGAGGMTNREGITKAQRNVHPSYYGNIDAEDTPEGDPGVMNHLTVDAAIGNDRGTISTKDPNKELGVGVLSTTCASIPYVSSCSGNRVMFSCAHTRQAVPIIGNEQPLCQTGYETILTTMLTDSYIRKSPIDGMVVDITENAIYIANEKRKIQVPMDPTILKSAQGKSSFNYFHPTVKIGMKVHAGQIVASGKHIKDNVISIGSNLLIALMGWKGYSYEDGYVISESIANQKMVSIVYDPIEVYIDSDTDVRQIVSLGQETRKGDPLITRASKQLEELLDLSEEEIVNGQYIKSSPGGVVKSIEIYPSISLKKFPLLIEPYMKFKARWEEVHGKMPERFTITRGSDNQPFSGVKIVFNIERFDKCVIGDKFSNNHGGKGVATYIEKDENMPVTPWGEKIEIMLNPLGVINRMNPSTIMEMSTGLIAKFMARKLVSYGTRPNQQAIGLFKGIYEVLDNTKDKMLSKNVIKAFTSMTPGKYAEFINNIKDNNYVCPIYVPPFQQPTAKMIEMALKIVGGKPKYRLYLPEYKKYTTYDVGVGYLYYKKLEHQAEYKLSSRSVGKYSDSTGQATNQAKMGGGQRLGEFDSWAMAAHGSEYVMKEMFGALADDRQAKDEILAEIQQTGEAEFRESNKHTTKELLDAYLRGMMLDAPV